MISHTKNRKGIVINPMLVLVLGLFIALALILFISDPAKKLDAFTTEKNKENLDTLDVGTLALMDSNFVNFDTAKAKTEMIKLIYITNTVPNPTEIDCSSTLTPEHQIYCDNIFISLSPAPPRYSTTPEGITIKVSYHDDTIFDGLEGYVNLTFIDVYEFDQVFTSKLGDFNSCTDPITESCFNESTTKPMTNLTLISMFNDEISVRMPFYYDNLPTDHKEDDCTAYANYSNLTVPNTKIRVVVDKESPTGPYNFTIVHMEKSHKREYPIYCNVSINKGSARDFPVQVVSGDYDLFRVYGWNSTTPDCIAVKDDVLVKKGDTTPVKIKFKC